MSRIPEVGSGVYIIFATAVLVGLSICILLAANGWQKEALWLLYFPALIHWFVSLVGWLGDDPPEDA